MDIQKIKEIALANGFSLKQQASGNMDLHSYVYEFAQAVAAETLNQSQLVFGQDGVTVFDTETLDSEISNISSEFEAEYFFDNDDANRLELLVAKSMKLGELYERQKWQAAQKMAVSEWMDYTRQSPSKDGRYQIFIDDEQLVADWEAPYGFSDPYDGCALIQELITHWAELPQPPVIKEPK